MCLNCIFKKTEFEISVFEISIVDLCSFDVGVTSFHLTDFGRFDVVWNAYTPFLDFDVI